MILEHLYGVDIELKHPTMGWFFIKDTKIEYNEVLDLLGITLVGIEPLEGQLLSKEQHEELTAYVLREYEDEFNNALRVDAYVPTKDEIIFHNSNYDYD